MRNQWFQCNVLTTLMDQLLLVKCITKRISIDRNWCHNEINLNFISISNNITSFTRFAQMKLNTPLCVSVCGNLKCKTWCLLWCLRQTDTHTHPLIHIHYFQCQCCISCCNSWLKCQYNMVWCSEYILHTHIYLSV